MSTYLFIQIEKDNTQAREKRNIRPVIGTMEFSDGTKRLENQVAIESRMWNIQKKLDREMPQLTNYVQKNRGKQSRSQRTN